MSASDLFQRRGHAEETLAVADLQAAEEGPVLVAEGPRPPHQEGPREEALGVTGTHTHIGFTEFRGDEEAAREPQ